MRKVAIFTCVLLLLVGLSSLTAASQPIKLSDSPNGVTLLQKDQSGLTLKVAVGSLDVSSVVTKGGNFTLLTANGLDRSPREGEPNLPTAGQLLAIPVGCELRVEVISSQVEEVSLTSLGITDPIMPVQPSLSKSQNPDDVPFVYDRDVYLRPGYYQLPAAEAEIVGTMRGIRVGRVQIAPVQYNVAENRIKVYKEMVVRINFDNPDWLKSSQQFEEGYSPAFEPVYGMVMNSEAMAFGVKDDLTRYPMTLVIVSARLFEAQLQPFIAWKIKKGFKVIVGYTDVVGTTTTAIKAYLQGLYNTETPKPSFVLLVGDTPQIPAFAGSAGSHITDLRFVEYTGDNLPEVYIGRFSAQTTAQLQPQIDKTLEYEQYLMPDPSYLGNCTLIAGADASYAATYGNGQINYGTVNYFNAAHGINANVWLYPASGGAVEAAIIATVNNGIGFANYTAHGGHDSWSDPTFSVSDINGLTNNHKYGLAVGNCCVTSTFGESTPCFGEAWLQKANGGGIGYIGATNNSYWDEDYWWGVGGGKAIIAAGPPYDATKLGAYDCTFHDHGEPTTEWFTTNYAMNYCGLLAIEQTSSSRKAYYWEMYCLMGDPSISCYMKVPAANTVAYNASLLMTSTSLTVQAAAGSYVAVSAAGVLHGAALVGPSGSVNVPLAAFGAPVAANVVVTGQNRVPYVGALQVIAPNGPYIIHDSHAINDAAGNNNGMVDFGESIVLGVQLINVGPDAANDVVATLSTTDSYVTITDNTENYGTMAGNMTTKNIANAFAFNVSPLTPDGHYVSFDVTVTGTQKDSVWTSSFTIPVFAPAVSYLSVTVNDAAGNNNGMLDPGETGNLIVTLQNTGSGTAYSVTAVFSELDDYVTVGDADGTFGTVAGGGGTANNTSDVFTVTAASNTPMGHALLAKLTINGSGGYQTSSNFNLTIGDRVVFFLEDFAVEQGWTGLGGAAQWQIAPAIGGSSSSGNPDPAEDHSPGSDDFVMGNNLGNPGSYAASIGSTNWVVSPIIDCSNASGVIMTYYHQLGVESPSYDHAYLEAFDGTNWVQLFANSAAVNESGWQESIFDIDTIAGGNEMFQIRFGFGPTDGSVQYCGWNIDDISLKGYVSGTGGTAIMAITPTAFSDSLVEGTNSPHTMVVNNEGLAKLRVRFTPSASWIECSGILNIINAGESLELPVTIKSAGLAPGLHTGTINYTSNDPGHATGSISVSVYIFAPAMTVTPESITKTVASHGQGTKELIINNTGRGKLNFAISCTIDNPKIAKAATQPPLQPLGFRASDPDKTGGQEPYFAPVTKGSGGPDTFGYIWMDSDEPGGPTYSWIEIEGTGTNITSGLSDDNFIGPFPIGFSFPFYDGLATEFYVSSNGFIGFGPSTDYGVLGNTALPTATTPNNILAWCWDDLNILDVDSPGGKVLYQMVGGDLVIEFARYPEFDGTTNPGDVITAEVILSPNGNIRIQYNTVATGFDVLSATVGIENATGTDGLQVVYNAAYLRSGLAIQIKNPTAGWLSADPMGGSVAPNSSDTVLVQFNAEEVDDGSYTGHLDLVTNDPTFPTKQIPVTMNAGQTIMVGDCNGDAIINITDAVYIINYIFGGGPAPNPLEAGDVQCDGMVNISDAVSLINFIFAGGEAPCGGK